MGWCIISCGLTLCEFSLLRTPDADRAHGAAQDAIAEALSNADDKEAHHGRELLTCPHRWAFPGRRRWQRAPDPGERGWRIYAPGARQLGKESLRSVLTWLLVSLARMLRSVAIVDPCPASGGSLVPSRRAVASRRGSN